MHLLFSYGTLQLEKVQITSFRRKLHGTKEVLKKFKLEKVRITDETILDKSKQEFHPIAVPSSNPNDFIEGVLFQISEEELAQADAYEVEDYKRIESSFQSGKKG